MFFPTVLLVPNHSLHVVFDEIFLDFFKFILIQAPFLQLHSGFELLEILTKVVLIE